MRKQIAFIYPGQGSQTVGMGESFLEDDKSRQFYESADQVLGMGLSKLMLEGPQEELTLTYHAQPALLTVSSMITERLIRAGVRPDYTAGHSLGEYSALVASNVLEFPKAVEVVHKRGLFMNEAVPAGEGAMAAILGMDADKLEEVTDDATHSAGVVQLANLNCPGQIVISGTKAGVEKACELAKERGAKRAIPLDVSGPFHSELMRSASHDLAKVLSDSFLLNAKIPVVTNFRAEPETNATQLQDMLIHQLYSPVLWEQSVRKMIDLGVTTFVEVGPGKVLSGLVKKIDRSVTVIPVHDLASFEKAVEELTT
ncbi:MULTISPECIES: ACP S-malonyltransferase [unclassified Planococcus (in: firmicutes)]|uniref:ACP S-malonyltransferase n=1 Tax=Planococcus TaxID=1372 RepID=UPI000C31F184|nr:MULTISPECIES: ACP S-malonyltransferase [unclassified Planococcus (in: firmicutes)]AUD14116.1 [acyl-carrier-protein] S-malonyltransferase [Planococcus sp. MB-3u-03]PKG48138.1 [acyl-carrier-protein] S-malonyltransferase [Planococcus sp. Urea-trap-24]PKG91986.1 [acyl-carrier-protein] S-malonyltransferase [Planococcus sp. Urea-3u-39]PKH43110.1 [acyl-carrier-protein] S-malonyltransferase [Planococcus sp. MB-3u-09]